MADFAPTYPGEILLTEFLKPMGISQYRIAKAIDVPPLDSAKAALAQRMHASGESAITIAATLGVSRATVYRVLAEG